MKAKGLCIATRCTSVDEFVARFRAFVGEDTIFVGTPTMRDVGVESTFAVLLADKTAVLRGNCVVVDAWPDGENPFKRPGIRCRVFDLTPDSAPVFERLKPAREPAPVEAAPTPAPASEPERCTPTMIGPPPMAPLPPQPAAVEPAPPPAATKRADSVDSAWDEPEAPIAASPAASEPKPVVVETKPVPRPAKEPIAPPQAVAIPDARARDRATGSRRVPTVQIPVLAKPRTTTSKAIAIPSKIPPVRSNRTEALPIALAVEAADMKSQPIVIPPRKTEAMPIALSTEAQDLLSRPIVVPPRAAEPAPKVELAAAPTTKPTSKQRDAVPAPVVRAKTEAGPLAKNIEGVDVKGTFHEEVPTLVDDLPDLMPVMMMGLAQPVAPEATPPKRAASGSGPRLLADGTGVLTRKEDSAEAAPAEIPIEINDAPTERASTPEMIVAEGSAGTRTPGSEFVLPANPLMDISEDMLEGFIDVRLFDAELDGAPSPSPLPQVLAQTLPGMEGPADDGTPALVKDEQSGVVGWTPVIPRVRAASLPPIAELTFDATLVAPPRTNWRAVAGVTAVTIVMGFLISFAAASYATSRVAQRQTHAQTQTK
ncbi:MAG TPA: hypothetical protein VFQ53_30095 [Kofleriaceae bacterium]|nr:hypothetical protein [Kofleriaceae bacterium]